MVMDWEEKIDSVLLPAVDEVINTLYKNSKISNTLDIGYLKSCTEIIQKKTSAYIASKSNALIEYGSNTDRI